MPVVNLTTKLLDNLKPGEKQTDYFDSEVKGLALRLSPGGTATWVIARRMPGESSVSRLKIGRYFRDRAKVSASLTPGSAGWRALTLKEAREEARETIKRMDAGIHPREHRKAERVQRAADSELGTLRQLLLEYIDYRSKPSGNRRPAGTRQIGEWRRMVDSDLRRGQDILDRRARDIGPGDIAALLRPIYEHGTPRPKKGRGSGGRRSVDGAKGQAAKVRTLFHAAFVWGLAAEHSLGRRTGTRFALGTNPVLHDEALVSSNAGTRALTDNELHGFWMSIGSTPGIGPVPAAFLRFTIATGGQRPWQILREPWTSYDLAARTVRLTDSKGRGGMAREHVVPLTDRAIEILTELWPFTGDFTWPFTVNGKAPISETTPNGAIAKWLQSDHGRGIPAFTPRDLRRTCAQLMQRVGISEESANRLQSHGLTGVTAKHYTNNPDLYVPEKRVASDALDAELARILDAP
ncbi:MAG TPA: integrase family protein [Luteibacter sp.]|nr:integrase family protein [Luteibacter sp.]